MLQNDRLLASTSWDGTARLWNLDTHLQVGSPLQHDKDVQCAAFSADGKLLSTGCDDENAYVWDIQAILKTAGIEDLMSIPDSQVSELKQKSSSGANAKRRPAIANRPPPRQVSSGFFDKVQDRSTLPSLGSRPRAPLVHLPSLFRRLPPNIDEPKEPHQCTGYSTFSRRSPPVVDVPMLCDKKGVYATRQPARAIDKGTLIKNPAWWARVMLFLCCASPSTDGSH